MQEMPLERKSVCKISLEPWALLWAPSVLKKTPCFPSKRGWNLCNAMNRFYSLLWTSVNVGVPTISKSFEGRRNIRSFLYLYKQVQYLITKNSLKKINGLPFLKKFSFAILSVYENCRYSIKSQKILCIHVSTLFILTYLWGKGWNCCMHNKCMGLYGNLRNLNCDLSYVVTCFNEFNEILSSLIQ